MDSLSYAILLVFDFVLAPGCCNGKAELVFSSRYYFDLFLY